VFDPSKSPSTLSELAQRSFVNFSSRPYLGQKKDKQYQFQTYAQIAERVKNISGAFLEIDFERGARIAILAESAPEWAICDLACQMCGFISVPLFSTLPSGQIKTILLDCRPAAILVSDSKQRAKIDEIKDELPFLEHIWTYDEFKKLEEQGAAYLAKNIGIYEQTWPAAFPNDVATIIYTSGTTGLPKGVMLTHKNIVANVEAICKVAHHLDENEVFLSFLPLAHVYERTAGHYFPLRLGASVGYCESLFTVDKNMAEVRPTVMACVPRLYESSREKLYSATKSLPEKKQKTYLAALELAKKAGLVKGHVKGARSLSFIEKIKFAIYDRLVYSKIRQKFGGRLKHFISGGAPIAPELGALFIGLGLETLEGYGLTETSPVLAVNIPGSPYLGTVGKPLSGIEIKIAEDGEILARGASIMKGYWEKPEETAAVLTKDGWFHTGDIGEFKEGILKITDRKKDLLVLANGKKVAPQPIEIRLQESRYIGQAVLLGDTLKSVTALIIPNFPALREWAAKENLGVTRDEELVKNAEVSKLFRREIDFQTSDLADFEKIRKFVLLSEPLSTQNGELTPTLKVKRNVIAEKYGALVAG
jgi:long-chain acyl-CoA synthetase